MRGTCDVAAVSSGMLFDVFQLMKKGVHLISEAASAIEELYFKALGAPSKRGVGCTAAEVTAGMLSSVDDVPSS